MSANSKKIEYGKISEDSEKSHLACVESELNEYESNRNKAKDEVYGLRSKAFLATNEERLELIQSANRIESSFSIKPNIINQVRDCPYIARLDFSRSGDNKRILYLSKGPINFLLKDSESINYIDWRAPIASLYYKYNQMPIKNASFTGPNGIITGNIDLTARIKIKNRKLNGVHANSSTSVNDELQQKLASGSSDKMHDIVDSIQSEQIELIQYDPTKNLIIQGSAGSGKTAIALHRVAQLLYDRDNYHDYEILFISPNKSFSDYISEVLPELNANVPIKTLDELYSDIFHKSPDSISEMIEDFFISGESYELSSHLSTHMDDSIHNVIYFAEEANKKLQNYNSLLDEMLRDDTFKLSSDLRNTNKKTLKPTQFRPISSEDAWNKWAPHSYKLNSYTRNFVPQLNIDNNLDFVFWAITETILNGITYRSETTEYNLRSEPRKAFHDIKHVVIDEAQDYTKWHLYLLHILMPRATFTILGDKNQNINPYIKNNTLRDILSEVTPDTNYVEINKSYRSSPEITEYTNTILGENIKPIRKSQKEEVDEFSFSDIQDIREKDLIADIDYLLESGHKRIAIITRESTTAELFKLDAFTNKGISVLPVYEAKGLEFDAVVAINTYDDDEKEMLYTACTRAMNKLVVYNVTKN